MKPRILVKVGTNVLTRANGRLDYNIIADLVSQLVELQKSYQVILVSSGAAGAGREFFDFAMVKDPLVRKQMLSSIGQGRLFQVYADFLKESSLIPAQALLTRADFHSKTAFDNIKTTLEHLLDQGILPIINENDVVSLAESSFGDNDQLAALTAVMMQVDLMVILSDIEGFYDADPKLNPQANFIPLVEVITEELMALCQDSLSSGGTGGMLSKIKAAQLVTSHGIPCIVTYGKSEEGLSRASQRHTELSYGKEHDLGREWGTYFKAKGDKTELSSRGSWITSAAEIKGSLTIDEGAAKALLDDKSLLAVGLRGMEGRFEKKDVVLIRDQEGIRIGAGLVNQSAAEIQGWLERGELPQKTVVIHKNHLYRYQR